MNFISIFRPSRYNIGVWLSLAYLLVVILAFLEIRFAPPDALTGLAIMFMTAPWSFWLIESTKDFAILPDEYRFVEGIAFLIICTLLNMLALYIIGALLTHIIRIFIKNR